MSKNHREPEVPEEEVPVVECLDGLARITLEELAITKNGTLQNACSTRPRVVVGLGKSAHSHIVGKFLSSCALSRRPCFRDQSWGKLGFKDPKSCSPVKCSMPSLEVSVVGITRAGADSQAK